MRRLSNRAWILLMLAICLAVTASAAGLVLSRHGAQAAAAPAPASSAPQPGSAQARADLGRMQSLLSSGSVSKQAALLVPPFKFAPGSKPIFPAGTAVMIKPGTLRSDGQFGIVEADLSGGKTVTLGLYAVQGHWRLYAVKAGSAQVKAKITAPAAGPVRARLLGDVTAMPAHCTIAPATIGTRVPVILIHGYKGSPSDWGPDSNSASMFYQVNSILGTYVSAFDYSQVNTRWVGDQAIGPEFAHYVHCMAQASLIGGGNGKVIIVAHSMGGLATRWAAAYGDGQKVTGDMVTSDIAKVITIGTPNTGTALASIGNLGRSSLLCGTSQFKLVWTDTQWCRENQALAGMSAFGDQIKALPELPPGIPLHAFAGDETVMYPLGLSIPVLPLFGDGLVLRSSALHIRQPRGSQLNVPVPCTAWIDPRGSCWHGALPNNPDIEQMVHSIVQAYVAANPPKLGGDAYWLAGGGQWHVHGGNLQIFSGPSGLTGMMNWNAGGNYITGHLQLAFTSQPDGSLAGTFTSDAWYTETTPPATCGSCNFQPPSTPEALKGQTNTLVPIAPMHAKEVFGSTSPPGWISGAAAGGNTNMCQAGLANETHYCGA